MLGVVVSAATGFASIHYLLKWLTRFGMLPYVIYRLVLGAVLLVPRALTHGQRHDDKHCAPRISSAKRRVGTSARSCSSSS